MATSEGPGLSPVSAGRSESFVNALEDPRYEAPFDQMEAVCGTAGHSVPDVRVVEHLPWSKKHPGVIVGVERSVAPPGQLMQHS